MLRVADTGVGIPAAEMPRLFDRFHRVPNARSRSNEGSGIGLALVRELVGLHGGTITAESSEGAGTAFTVRLPFTHLPAAPSAAGVAAAPGDSLAWRPSRTSRRRCAGCRRRTTGAHEPAGAAATAGALPGSRAGSERRGGRGSCSPTTTPTCGSTCSGCCGPGTG